MSGTALPVATRELRCPRCGATNRVGAYGLDKLPRCGKCQAVLPESFGRRAQRQLKAYWRLLMITTMVVGAIWWKPTLLNDLFLDHRKAPAETAVDYCANYPQPVTGVQKTYDAADRVAPLTIKTKAGGGYFVKLEESISRQPVMTLFVRGGETLRARVPEGSFVLKYATGDQWCGEINLFGPDTSTNQADKIFIFDEDHSFTVELIARKGGNLRTKAINRRLF